MVEQFLGKWTLHSSENFEDYMKALGVNLALRKMGIAAKPDLVVSVNDSGVITVKSQSTFKNIDVTFKLDEEFDETTADGRKTKTVFTLDNGKLVQLQKWDGKETTIERAVQGGQLIATCTMGDVVSTRTYNKAA
ncbi:fatty acid-binding protein, adipocyte-like [Nelusetta ayraudi]|uniref:fatty acid-binding protein, adipocyte-like n=1 Tax=Nelusetta ayraudi TaxID=303726 RepID=UPI003F719642